MAYLGNPPATQFASLTYQDLTGGSGTTFTLDSPVGSAQDIEVFVNNVRQEPGVAYDITGSTGLTMTGSIASTDDFYVVFQGKSIGTVSHPSGSALEASTGTFSGAVSATNGTFSGNASVTGTSALTGAVTVGPADSGGTASAADADDLVIDNAADGGMSILSANTAIGNIRFIDSDGTAGAVRYDHSGDAMSFVTNNGTRMTILAGGSVGINTTSPSRTLDVNGTANFGSVIYANNEIRVNTSGNTPSQSSNSVTYAGARLETAGASHVFVATSDQVLLLNRQGTDGAIVTLYGQGNAEGSISVSGSTVTYGGGHLARWSRLPSDARDTSIVKGTVMTNLDEMVVWQKNDGTVEDNEQLNKTDVSSVEGDVNVAGVFDHWDDDDDEGYDDDFYLAETGDFVIRIAQGTTVARGDLLMSAGDGTAKPQGDDIVRSKTVAKVTSTNVSHTYDDGSYLVPCVLMAC